MGSHEAAEWSSAIIPSSGGGFLITSPSQSSTTWLPWCIIAKRRRSDQTGRGKESRNFNAISPHNSRIDVMPTRREQDLFGGKARKCDTDSNFSRFLDLSCGKSAVDVSGNMMPYYVS